MAGSVIDPGPPACLSERAAPAIAARVIAKLLAHGLADHQAGRLGEAERVYRRILELDTRHAEALHLLGMIAFQTGHCAAAAELISAAILENASDDRYFSNLGNVLQKLGRLEEAVGCYRRALLLNPASAAAHGNLGMALHFLNRLEEAALSFETALELAPEVALMHTNLGSTRQAQGRLEEAAGYHQRALALEPENAEAWCNLGSVLDLQGRTAEAESAYERALAIKPEFEVALLNGSLLHLRKGEFALGLQGYEHRWQLQRRRSFTQPQWTGEPLNGARILLYAEQGLGDALQFIRYLPMVQAAGGRVILEVQPQLRRLLYGMDGIEELIGAGEALPPFDWHCPLLSLPLAFGTEMETIPNAVPYLTVPQEAAEKAACFRWPKTGLRIGVVWAGRPEHLRDRYRSIPLPLLAPVFQRNGACFFALQLGPAASELAVGDAGKALIDLSGMIEDMADTAALIAHLDLLITVDTAVAHLAGAIGKQVWVMLPQVPDWRWLTDREESPWYPTMRLFRQTALGDWTPVVEAVGRALEQRIRAS